MSSAEHTATPPASVTAPGEVTPALAPAARLRARLLATRAHPRHLALAGVLALSAVLNTYRLSQNGYANIFYSAGVKSMLHSLHNFLFVSFDPGGLISVDKPPLGLWVQVASAKLFGLSPLSVLLPEAIAGVLVVALIYHLLARRLGAVAGLAAALALAVFPSFVAVSRDNGVDTVLILLMALACGAGLRAAETGRWRTILWSGVLVGLAFNTKTLAAYLVVPGIALAYLVCAPGSLLRRATQLLVAGVVMVAVSFSWIALVELTPASKRPYVGSSTNNTELGLTFEYNGFGRVNGQVGGPGRVPFRPGARVHPTPRPSVQRRRPSRAARPPASGAARGGSAAAEEREKTPIPFGGPPGPLRLFGVGLGDQGAWMVPFALFGLLALALLGLAARRSAAPSAGQGGPGGSAAPADPGGPDDPGGAGDSGSGASAGEPAREPALTGRRDPRLATTLVLGGWFLVEVVLLSLSKGIVHPYYVSALGPGTGAMAGAGAVALVALARGRRRPWAIVLVACAVAATVAAQLVLMRREHYIVWFIPVLVAGAIAGVGAMVASRRLRTPAMALLFCLLLVAPAAYATTTWLAPVQGTFPAAGPRHSKGAGGVGVSGGHLHTYQALMRYVGPRAPHARWPLFTDAATTAAPFILMDMNAGSLAGYSGTDPAIDGPRLAGLVTRGEARYVVLGGQFSARGGNRATAAVLRACRQLPPESWEDPNFSPYGLVLFDCAGHERALASG
jgi:4-amino-4-deoxy-L-arabinose transferase-like glycosyltransferase